MTVGVICEYNPFHRGHQKQFHLIREKFGPDTTIVCLMSGNFVQRGAPAIVDKSIRAKAAILSGADLVLELPVTCALSSAEGFAAGAVRILTDVCDALCFGAETADGARLQAVAAALLTEEFSLQLKQQLSSGISFPAARQNALAQLGEDGSLLTQPNNILAVEYCKAIRAQSSNLIPVPICREGSYHDLVADAENPSATSVRRLMLSGSSWQQYVPDDAASLFETASKHRTAFGERAILSRLRTMTEAEFEALPYGSEGLWRKFMHAVRSQPTLETVLEATKSKRYTRTRLDRMMLCAFLGLTADDLSAPAPYARILAFRDRGRCVLKSSHGAVPFYNTGASIDSPYQAIENRCSDLYGLLAENTPEPPGAEQRRRVYYHKG